MYPMDKPSTCDFTSNPRNRSAPRYWATDAILKQQLGKDLLIPTLSLAAEWILVGQKSTSNSTELGYFYFGELHLIEKGNERTHERMR